MQNKNKHIDDFFRESFSEGEILSPSHTWSVLAKKLLIKKFFTFSISSFKVFYSAVIVSSAIITGVYLFDKDTTDQPLENPIKEEKVIEEVFIMPDTVVQKQESQKSIIHETEKISPAKKSSTDAAKNSTTPIINKKESSPLSTVIKEMKDSVFEKKTEVITDTMLSKPAMNIEKTTIEKDLKVSKESSKDTITVYTKKKKIVRTR